MKITTAKIQARGSLATIEKGIKTVKMGTYLLNSFTDKLF